MTGSSWKQVSFELKFSKPATDFDADFIQISVSLNSKKTQTTKSPETSVLATRLVKS